MISDAFAADLLEEVGAKNHVRVAVFRALPHKGGGLRRKQILDEFSDDSVARSPALLLQDHVRMLLGRKPIFLGEWYRRLGGQLVSVTPNLRTTVGADFAAAQLSGTSVAVADWIALSNNTLAVAAADTSATLPWSTAQATDAAASGTTGEWTALGLARKVSTYAHTGGTAVYTQAATWTASATSTSSSKAGLFGGAAKNAQGSGGTNVLFLANTFTATSLVTNDQLSLTWTVNV